MRSISREVLSRCIVHLYSNAFLEITSPVVLLYRLSTERVNELNVLRTSLFCSFFYHAILVGPNQCSLSVMGLFYIRMIGVSVTLIHL